MDVNPDSPWNPRVPVDISPGDFEKLVLEWLRRSAEHQQQTITTEHLGVAYGDGGHYKIDVLVTFSALGGALFVVLVEILFSTSGFQSGALEFAASKHIATVAVVQGEWLYETRAVGGKPAKPPPWVHFDPHAGIRMTKTQAGLTCHTIELSRVDAIVEWLGDRRPEDAYG